MISRELLNEVLNDEVGDYFYYKDNLIWFEKDGKEYNINIYEFAHKCKEWALDNRWIISTMPMLTEKKWRNTSVRLSHFYSASKDRYLDGIYHNGRIEADTETEAIFKACEWIMENKCGS